MQPDVNTPAPTNPEPAPQQPAPTAPAPQEPSSPAGDGFEQLFSPAPAEPTPAAPTEPQPAQPTEPTQPTEPVQPTQAPAEPTEPVAPVAPAPAPIQSTDDYMASITGGIPDAPKRPAMPDANSADQAEVDKFFDDLVQTAVKTAEINLERKNAIHTAEKRAWDDAFDKYGTLRNNKELRDMVHNIRMGSFRQGKALTPTQAADQLLDSLKKTYQRGATDASVVTSIQDVQPTGGGTVEVPTNMGSDEVMRSIAEGGEGALANYLDGLVKNNQL